mmetsp:Transcript_34295/g.96650  ORF Transcript_34295/g.96650 Transcript_34295/m.96650 type:complete len:266 (+) Transcript_34295:146-943(+)|eukprot:CAMPEP_0119119708 /NCGR_PEP_ID=MMETSP1310-20130426/1078_1 /TAXON_ID=464262 /ORGANISM="Genus nov. species nov., Strain RCC2339" /LENGTH=265 /DNA_ID=CAMNT_0007109155 /DNA_START=122 /DNA_END=919 /DNA_ORIENTATION=-
MAYLASPAQKVGGVRRKKKGMGEAKQRRLARDEELLFEELLEEDLAALGDIPLQDTWVLWFDRYIGPGFSAEEYAAALKEVCTFSSVQEFWCWYNHLPQASGLDVSCTYHLMKQGIRPLWEDAGNVNGGNLCVKMAPQELDHAWTMLSLSAIGGAMEGALLEGDSLCGISVGMRKNDATINIWNADASLVDTESMVEALSTIVVPDAPSAGGWNTDSLAGRDPIQTLTSNSVYKIHKDLTNFGNKTVPKESKMRRRISRGSPNRR